MPATRQLGRQDDGLTYTKRHFTNSSIVPGVMDKHFEATEANLPSLEQLEASARRLLTARVLSKGGKPPSEEAFELAVKTLARRAFAEGDKRSLSQSTGSAG